MSGIYFKSLVRGWNKKCPKVYYNSLILSLFENFHNKKLKKKWGAEYGGRWLGRKSYKYKFQKHWLWTRFAPVETRPTTPRPSKSVIFRPPEGKQVFAYSFTLQFIHLFDSFIRLFTQSLYNSSIFPSFLLSICLFNQHTYLLRASNDYQK